MVKKNKLVFNLSLKDLKELGVFKKKRRKRRTYKKKALSNLNYDVKSSSAHMPTNTFMSTNNLQNENLSLINRNLEKLAIEPKATSSNDLIVSLRPQLDRLNNLENNFRAQKQIYDQQHNFSQQLFSDLYGRHMSKPEIFQTRDKSFVYPSSKNIVREDTFDDNVDVSASGGSSTFSNAFGISPSQLLKEETEELIGQAKDSGDNAGGEGEADTNIAEEQKAAGGGIGNVDKNLYETYPEEHATIDDNPMKETKQIKPKKYIKKISHPTITKPKQDANLTQRKKAYIELMTQSGQVPSNDILQTANISKVSQTIKNKFPDYYKQNIAKK
jgi:hypothetical protein